MFLFRLELVCNDEDSLKKILGYNEFIIPVNYT